MGAVDTADCEQYPQSSGQRPLRAFCSTHTFTRFPKWRARTANAASADARYPPARASASIGSSPVIGWRVPSRRRPLSQPEPASLDRARGAADYVFMVHEVVEVLR